MNVEIKLIKHSEASNDILEKIAKIKSIRWKYSEIEQLLWMQKNLQQEDVHLLIYLKEEIIAYSNFVRTEVIINGKPTPFMGLGNVCTLESGKGYGEVLMNGVNMSLLENNWSGILLCKENLISYYNKYNWILVPKLLIDSERLLGVNTMLFNYSVEILNLDYFGKNF